jgi:GH15 family glucan-1,4-alpha-glucosidase
MLQGWNADKKSFVQYYGSNTVDASVLLMTMMGFVGAKGPWIQTTLDTSQQVQPGDVLTVLFQVQRL